MVVVVVVGLSRSQQTRNLQAAVAYLAKNIVNRVGLLVGCGFMGQQRSVELLGRANELKDVVKRCWYVLIKRNEPVVVVFTVTTHNIHHHHRWYSHASFLTCGGLTASL